VVVEKLKYYQTLTGDDFWEPSSLLLKLAKEGSSF